MCAEYNLKTSERDLAALLNISILNTADRVGWEQHTRLYDRAPVLSVRDGQVILEEMRFSLLPPGGRVPFTANARLDDWDEIRGQSFVYDRPTWRESFLKRRCIVPVSEIIEPIYQGEHIGKMIGFQDRKNPILFVAGFFKETVDVRTGEVFNGFCLLTDFAHPFVRQIGHSRTVIILPPQAAYRWMAEPNVTAKDSVRFLLEHKMPLDLVARPVRTMKNWEKRVKKAIEGFQEEEKIRSALGR